MCGRYSNDAEFSDIRVRFEIGKVELFRSWQVRYNICPTHAPGFEQLFVVSDGTQRSAHLGRWWMIPSFWSKPLKALPSSFNARAEDIASKAFWREPFASRRCLVPATGWREFTDEGGRKQPHHFELGHQLFAFAGLWSRWNAPDATVVESFAIVTTVPTAQASAIHDRMPLVLSEEYERAWLDPTADPTEVLEAACARAQELQLAIYPSNPIGNSSRFEGPQVLEPAPETKPKQLRLF